MLNFAENQGSRVFHLMMILPAGVLLLLLSLISLSTLAVVNKQFTDEHEDEDVTCILYAESEGTNLEYSEGQQCTFSIVGGGILSILALLFIVTLVAKAVIGVGVLGVFSLVELVLSVFGAVWAFIVSVVITAGLDETCKAFSDARNRPDNFPCCAEYCCGDLGDDDNVFFYEAVNSSRITAWFAMVLLLFLAGFYLCIVIKYFCGGRTTSHSTATGDEGGPPPKYDDDPNPI